jgi:hypothetical protein
MNTVKPQMLILKPALIGGFASSDEWMKAVESHEWRMGHYIRFRKQYRLKCYCPIYNDQTLSLPARVGYWNAIYNNIPAPYSVDTKGLHFHPDKYWDLSQIL